MDIHIPVWVFWATGVVMALPVVGIVGYFAVIGWMMRKVFSK